MTYLSLENISKHFGSILAVQQMWLTVDKGEIVSLLGPSGCGKSTTLQIIAGIQQPDTGAIALDGQRLNTTPPEQRDVALVLQRGLLFPHLTVGENVAFGLKMRGINRVDREKAAIAMLQQVQLDGFAPRKPSELSGGQAQRVALARSLIIRPKLLLLDEPLSALDASLREDMQDLILGLQAQTGITFMIVTHDQAEAAILSQRIALMFDGKLRQVDTPERLYRCPCDEETAQFMGGVNFFEVEARDHQWRFPNGATLTSSTPYQGTIRATVRPEHIDVMAHAESVSSQSNCLSGVVTQHRFTGMQRRVTIEITPRFSLQAWISPSQVVSVGQMVTLHIAPNALWGFPSFLSLSQPRPVRSLKVADSS
jgi:ABC-type Fe3+/spermidine/putrescine transport system ATPase subunit